MKLGVGLELLPLQLNAPRLVNLRTLPMASETIYQLTNASILQNLNYKENRLVFSSLNNFSKTIASEGVSIKFVTRGTEHYQLNKKRVTLRENMQFISTLPLEGAVSIESKQSVQGICLNLSYSLIREIENSLRDVSHLEGATGGESALLRAEVFETAPISNSLVVQKIKALQANKMSALAKDNLFFELGEAIVLEQLPRLQYCLKLNKARLGTKKDIVRRLLWAKDHLEANFTQEIQVKDLAQIASMSEFHFSRMFKMAFGYSPHQFQIKLRLEKAKRLLENQEGQVHEIALLVGYPDIYAFSKAYRRYFSETPSFLLQSSRN